MRYTVKYFCILTVLVTLCSCVASSNRSGNSSIGSGGFVSSHDVTLLADKACICRQGQPRTNINPNCFSVCSEKPATTEDTLFLDTFLGPGVELNPDLGSLYNWCRRERTENGILITSPECSLLVENAEGQTAQLDVDLNPSSPNFSVNVQALNLNETYIISLIETVSGNTSNSIQVRKESVNTGGLGSLEQIAINQYSCLIQPTDNNVYDFEQTYYYGVTPPLAIPAAVQGIACHVGVSFDSPLLPRRNLVPNVFRMWSPNDPRFYDNDGDGDIDVHDRIIDNTSITEVEVFQSLSWNREPPQAQPDNAGEDPEQQPLGFMLVPFIHSETHPLYPLRSYCPGDEEYASSDQLFRELGFMIGAETEGIYIGRRNQQQFIDPDSGETITIPENNILINESELKRIWFYVDASLNKQFPTEENVRNQIVYFYFPPAQPGFDPHIQRTGQELYQLVSGESTGGGAPTHDKKIGCIPKSP